jgi:hypothetical protein
MASGREQAIRSIQKAKRARDSAGIAGREASEDLRKCCQDALRSGVPVTRIAEEAGLSRDGVNDLLSERPSRGRDDPVE